MVVKFLWPGVRRRRGRQRGAVGGARDPAAARPLSSARHQVPAGARVPLGRASPLPLPRTHATRRVAPRRLLTVTPAREAGPVAGGCRSGLLQGGLAERGVAPPG